MDFNSISFLCFFLPVIFVLYYLIPSNKIKNILLLIFSVCFYTVGEPIYILLLFASAIINYLFGLIISSTVKFKKMIFAVAIIANVTYLFTFKFLAFEKRLLLPLGISFYTFQIISYIFDVYRGKINVQKNFLYLFLYISLFPQIALGPIVKYHDIENQLVKRSHSIFKIEKGIKKFIIGLSKKVLIAGVLSQGVEYIFNLEYSRVNILVAWLGALTYFLLIYYDFSGYSDMAIGLAKMFGFDYKENFNYPYAAKGIKDFWSRWHISLSSWFKEYLYIPLGGNRKGKIRTIINKYIVFFVTAIWHGFTINYLVWGLSHGTLLVLEDSKKIPFIGNKIVLRVYTWLGVILTFVIFGSKDLQQGMVFVKNMFVGFFINASTNSAFFSSLNPLFMTAFFIGMIFIFPIKNILLNIKSNKKLNNLEKRLNVMASIVTLVLLIICIIRLSSSSYQPFIYARF